MFLHLTVCSEKCFIHEWCQVSSESIDLNLLCCLDRCMLDENVVDSEWLEPSYLLPPITHTDGPLADTLLDNNDIHTDSDGKCNLILCWLCFKSLNNGKAPLAFINCNFLGLVPDELKDLTVIEGAMIASCRVKCWIVQLKGELWYFTTKYSMRYEGAYYYLSPVNIRYHVSVASTYKWNDNTYLCCLCWVISKRWMA